MADAIVEVIQKLGLDASAVYAELDAVKAKYQASNKELEQTQKEIERLTQKEAQLLAARKNSNNPTAVALYNKKLEETRKSIETNERAIKSLTTETARLGREAESTEKKIQKAFAQTKNAGQTNGLFGAGTLLSVAGGLGVATGIAAVAGEVRALAGDSVDLAAKAEGVKTAFSNIGGEKTLQKLRDATRGASSDVDLMSKALRAKNFGIDVNLLAKGLELAGKTARTTGQDVNFLADSFVDGVGRKSLKILDNLQISQVDLQREIKKTGDFNTAVGNIIDRKLKETGIVVETTADKTAKLSASWAHFKNIIGDFLIGAGDGLVKFFDVLRGKMSFQDANMKTNLEVFSKNLQTINGRIIDEAKTSEERRLALLSDSSDRIVELVKKVGSTATQADLDSINKRILNASGFERVELINEAKRIERIVKRTKEEFLQQQVQLGNERKLNDDLRNLNKKRTEDFDEEAAKRAKKERDILEAIEIDIRKAQSVLRGQTASNTLNSEVSELDKIEARFIELSIQKNIEFEKRADNIKEEIQNETLKTEALVKLKLLENIELNTLDNQRLSDIRDLKFKQTAAVIEGAKTTAELEMKIAQAQTTFAADDYDARVAVLVDYTSKKTQLMQAEGKDEIDILKFVLDQTLAIEQIKKEQFLKIQKQRNSEFEEEERFHLANLEYKRRIHQSQITTSQIKFEEVQLDQMRKDYDAQVALTGKQDEEQLLAIKKQENDIALLKKKQRKEERQEIIDQTLFVIDNINKVTQATVDAANQFISAEISKVDKLIGLQQQRVDAIAAIAEKGNAQILELEKERLEKLTKEREKYVRQQQTLASIELIANTAVTVSKAAAEGGAGAAFTIAAALIALVAGLASARSIAGQAAFYKGGEFDGSGFTGEGNPRDASTGVGRKPYTYHKKEFIFDHQATGKYLDIFRKIHKGDIDLNQMKFEADMYKTLNDRNIDTSREIKFSPIINNGADVGRLSDKLDGLIKAVEAQPGMSVHLDDKGLYIITNRFVRNQKRIDNLTR